MPHETLQLRYLLNRLQRLVPHLRIWGVFTTFLILALIAFLCVRAIAAVWSWDWSGTTIFSGLALGTLVLFRGLFIGLIDILTVQMRDMDVVFEDNAVGILLGNERRYLFLDGIISISKYRPDIWTIQHHNGSVLNLPVSLISDEQMSFIKNAMEYGHSPAGARAVVERGKTIAYLRRTGGNKE